MTDRGGDAMNRRPTAAVCHRCSAAATAAKKEGPEMAVGEPRADTRGVCTAAVDLHSGSKV